MGNCCKTYPTIETTDFPDEFFTHFHRQEPMRKTDPVLKKVQNQYLMYMLKNPKIMQYRTKLAECREPFSKMCQVMEERTWVDREETAKKVDVQVIQQNAEEGVCCDTWVIRPKDHEGGAPLATLVFAHGGGAIMCQPLDMICTFRYVSMLWNCCVIMPRYRLAPEHKQPAGQEDFVSTFNYFHANAAKYNIDPSRMAAAGESGGGLICLGGLRRMIQSGDISKVRVAFVHEPMIAGTILDLPKAEFTKAEKESDMQNEFKWIYKMNCVDSEKAYAEKDPEAFPAHMPEDELKQMPMTFCMTSEFDMLRRDCLFFAKRLQAVGKLAGISDEPGVDHGWSYNGNIPCIERWNTEWKSAFEAYTGPQ